MRRKRKPILVQDKEHSYIKIAYLSLQTDTSRVGIVGIIDDCISMNISSLYKKIVNCIATAYIFSVPYLIPFSLEILDIIIIVIKFIININNETNKFAL